MERIKNDGKFYHGLRAAGLLLFMLAFGSTSVFAGTLNQARLERIRAKQKMLQEELNAEKEKEARIEAAITHPVVPDNTPPTLEETRLTMDKWIETQQIISKERKDWQQGKEILEGRVELIKNEVTALEEKIKIAQSNVTESHKDRSELLSENDKLKETGEKLTETISGMESQVRKLFKSLPDPVKTKLQPLSDRIPEDPAKTRVAVAERYQNILGILNELNKANNEITVNYEIHTLSNNKPSEVKAIYIGLAQAYYVSGGGEGGIGRPTEDGWKWEPSNAIGRDITTALEILEGKHTPAFVPLPVRIQ